MRAEVVMVCIALVACVFGGYWLFFERVIADVDQLELEVGKLEREVAQLRTSSRVMQARFDEQNLMNQKLKSFIIDRYLKP